MASTSPILHKLVLEKRVICKIIFQTSEALKAQIMIIMSHLITDSDTGNKWKALELAELSVSLPQDMKE